MKTFLVSVLEMAHSQCRDNRAQLESTKQAGCFHCLKTFPTQTVTKWIREDTTALCPHCGINSVITGTDLLAPEFLKAMQDHWFGIDLPL